VVVWAELGLPYGITVVEKGLEAETGDLYRQFAATRELLIPFVWSRRIQPTAPLIPASICSNAS
jgi:hypothetical protein